VRANCLPVAEEVLTLLSRERIQTLLPEFEAALNKSIRVAELFLGETIRRRKIEKKVHLGEMCLVLDEWPIKNLIVEGTENAENLIYFHEGLGLLFTELPREIYGIAYEVGYEEGEVPALIKNLIELLIKRLLIEDYLDSRYIEEVIKVRWEERAKQQEEREAYGEAGRARISERLNQYSEGGHYL